MTDPIVIADQRWFDVSTYSSWDDYNFKRPVGDTVLTVLARRDLFLDAARELNNPMLTNMSPEALAALTFAQTYVEEKWDHQPPWDGDSANPIFNWVHPVVLDQPDLSEWLYSDELDQLRSEYWWATYFSFPLGVFQRLGVGKGTDVDEALRGMRPPNANAPRLAGYAYPVGNQLYLQTAETAYWYADYLKYGAQRYGAFTPQVLDTRIDFPAADSEFDQIGCAAHAVTSPPEYAQYPGLCQLFNAPFAAELRRELTQPETAAFWNVMRFVHAGARQREGGASPDFPGNGQPAIFALRYGERSPEPGGRAVADVSAFALLTTVYSDSILLDFTNWDANRAALIVTPSDTTRSDGIDRQVSERNKAIYVIEHLGSEAIYPERDARFWLARIGCTLNQLNMTILAVAIFCLIRARKQPHSSTRWSSRRATIRSKRHGRRCVTRHCSKRDMKLTLAWRRGRRNLIRFVLEARFLSVLSPRYSVLFSCVIIRSDVRNLSEKNRWRFAP